MIIIRSFCNVEPSWSFLYSGVGTSPGSKRGTMVSLEDWRWKWHRGTTNKIGCPELGYTWKQNLSQSKLWDFASDTWKPENHHFITLMSHIYLFIWYTLRAGELQRGGRCQRVKTNLRTEITQRKSNCQNVRLLRLISICGLSLDWFALSKIVLNITKYRFIRNYYFFFSPSSSKAFQENSNCVLNAGNGGRHHFSVLCGDVTSSLPFLDTPKPSFRWGVEAALRRPVRRRIGPVWSATRCRYPSSLLGFLTPCVSAWATSYLLMYSILRYNPSESSLHNTTSIRCKRAAATFLNAFQAFPPASCVTLYSIQEYANWSE